MAAVKTVGVLALQGAFREHIKHIRALGHTAVEVRTPEDLEAVEALILPGGESTTMGKLLKDFALKDPIVARLQAGMPVWGTCAGMILLAKEIEGGEAPHLATMNIVVRRNAYGRQLGSFDLEAQIPRVSQAPLPLVFIRAPFIVSVGDNVEEIHHVNGNLVAAREGNMFVTSFHPELTNNSEFHRYFMDSIG